MVGLERDIAVLAARFNAHEASCNERMVEVRDTFEDVKKTSDKINDRINLLLMSVTGTAFMLLIAIVLKALKLT